MSETDKNKKNTHYDFALKVCMAVILLWSYTSKTSSNREADNQETSISTI